MAFVGTGIRVREMAEAPVGSLEARAASIIARNPALMVLMRAVKEQPLADGWVVAGALYGTIWNALTGRPPLHGLKDFDVVYFDSGDRSWAAEDRAIRALAAATAVLPLPVELRNQARVHCWFAERFGVPYPKLASSLESLHYYASTTHAIAARLGACESAAIEIAAPFGLEDIFAMRVRPNHALDNSATHEAKARRIAECWPEAVIEPW